MPSAEFILLKPETWATRVMLMHWIQLPASSVISRVYPAKARNLGRQGDVDALDSSAYFQVPSVEFILLKSGTWATRVM